MLRTICKYFLLLLVILPVAVAQKQRQDFRPDPNRRPARHLKLGPSIPRTVYAPLVRCPEFPFAQLALNNRSPQATEASIVFFAKNGKASAPVTITVAPAEVKHLDIDDLLPVELRHVPELGGIAVGYTGQWNQVAAQLTLISASRRGSLDLPLRPQTDLVSQEQSAVWYLPKDGRAAVAIGSDSDQDWAATIDFGDGKPQTKMIRGHATEIIEAPAVKRGNKEFVGSARVTSSGPPGALRASGFITHGDGYGHIIRFYDSRAVRQPDLFAANVTIADSDLQIVLKNVGDKPLTATPRFQPVGQGAASMSSPAVTLQPGEATLLDSTLVLEQARNGIERVSRAHPEHRRERQFDRVAFNFQPAHGRRL